ncbi:MAG: hypothetical protein NT167_08480 [Verrucomicrobia bacterium]|nr:hypothetical protein [Verrucomicrobiota bacterium]
MNIQLNIQPNNQHPTTNIQHPATARAEAIGCSMLDVRCWLLNIGCRVFPVGLWVCLLAPSALAGPGPDAAPPSSPREYFNAGTRQLSAGKLREAEASLETALTSQDERLQPPALYNLGLVRFKQGAEELKKGPAAKPTLARGQKATEQGDEALHQVEGALASDDMLKMVAAYMRGRGARKELKGATEAVQRALKAHGSTLARWERSSGDLKSTLELNSADSDARHNAEVVDRCIAKLVDSIQELQQCSSGSCNKKNELSDALTGEEEEEEQEQKPQPGQQEGPSKDGQETTLSPEQAAWLLDSYRLDSERRLPMGETPSQPKERSRPTW